MTLALGGVQTPPQKVTLALGGVQTPPLEGDTCSWGGPRVRDRVCVRVRVRVCVVRARVRYT